MQTLVEKSIEDFFVFSRIATLHVHMHTQTHIRRAVLKWICLFSIINLTSFSEPLAQSLFPPKSEYNNTSTNDKETVSQYFFLKVFPGSLLVTLQVMHNFNLFFLCSSGAVRKQYLGFWKADVSCKPICSVLFRSRVCIDPCCHCSGSASGMQYAPHLYLLENSEPNI